MYINNLYINCENLKMWVFLFYWFKKKFNNYNCPVNGIEKYFWLFERNILEWNDFYLILVENGEAKRNYYISSTPIYSIGFYFWWIFLI